VRKIGLFLLTIVAMLSVATMNSQAQTVLTRHVREVVSTGQAPRIAHMPSAQTMSLDIVLPLSNQAGLDLFLQQIYNPASPNYHQFLTVQQFADSFGPTQQQYDAVVKYAQANGLTVIGSSPSRMNVHVQGPVASVESAFHVTMNTYQHPTENRAFFAADREPTVDLPFPLWHVAGLDNYSIPQPAGLSKNANTSAQPKATTGSGPSASFLGSDMRAAYYGGTALTGAGQTLGLLEFVGTDLADVTTYFTNAKQTNNVPIQLVSTDGTTTSCVDTKAGGSCDDTEQTLDITQAIGMAPGLKSLVVYVGSTDAAIFHAMATASPLNAQLSSSWTWSPADPTTDNPYFEEFAAQGQNLFQAAGDSSKWTTNGTASEVFPADDIYVTSVGGTDLNTTGAGSAWSSETAWADSGGGISPHNYAIPSWQTAAAAGCGSCSKTYRNGPDVSANANFTFYVCADQTTCTANSYGGTSFAAPMWAGYLALVNQQAAINGATKGIGFINPSLYTIGMGSSYGSDFHDITSGSNGFSATTGYDLVTGWGSPNGSGLIAALGGPVVVTPAFTLSASPATVSVVSGNSGNSTITTTVSGGFTSAVALTATGQPTGVTVTFSPTSIASPGAGTSTATLAVASTTAAGTYTITVTGSGSGLTHTATISLTVTKPVAAAFTIAVSPTAGYLAQGQSGYAIVTTAVSGGFSSAVALSATGLPSGVTGSFSPASIASPGSGTSDFTLTVSKSAPIGTYPITITGSGGGLTHTTVLTFQVIR